MCSEHRLVRSRSSLAAQTQTRLRLPNALGLTNRLDVWREQAAKLFQSDAGRDMGNPARDKVILITARSVASARLSRGVFAAEGVRLVLHRHQNLTSARQLQKELSTCESLVVAADLTKEAAVKNCSPPQKNPRGHAHRQRGQMGKYDVPLHEMSLAQWRAPRTAC